ncbi:MAG: DNA replication protein [Proteobacteria bacterium SG_bin9]|nr:MAG: DNA replication protein [Proteobacteria bacterium SG_bin9]
MKKPDKRIATALLPDGVDRFRAQHLDLAQRDIVTDAGVISALVNESESPLAWLARRKGRDGRCLIDSHQFLAGERLRADFTRGSLTPRITSHWGLPTGGGGSRGAGDMTDLVVASRQRLKLALDACGPEFSGLLMDVCCFLRGLDDVERERGWPSRSAKIVLQLGLDRLARHYGLKAQLKGNESSPIRVWSDNE